MKPATPKTELPTSTQLRKVVFGGALISFFSLTMALSVAVTNGIECGCATNGSYVSPLAGIPPAVIPSSSNAGSSPGGVYRVTANVVGSIVNLVVTSNANGAQLLQAQLPSDTSWGFSPDDHRFVYHYFNGSVHNVSLFNLAGSTPQIPCRVLP